MTAANWVNDQAPQPGDDLVFPAGALRLSSTNDFPAGTSFRSITLGGAGYTLNGNLVALTAGLTMDVPTSTAAAGATVNLPLRFGSAVTVASLFPGSTLTLSGTLDTAGNSLTADGSGDLTINGIVSGAGGIIKNGIGTLTLGGNNNYTGVTTVNKGILSAASNNALGASGAGQGTVVNRGATLLTPGGILTLPEPLTLNGDGVQAGLPNARLGALSARGGFGTWTGPITLGSDTTLASDGATFFTLNGPIDLGSNTLTINSYFPIFCTVNGVIRGSGNLAINRSLADTTVALTAANTYTGSTTVYRATLQLRDGGTLASTDYVLNQGGVLLLDNSNVNLTDRLPDAAVITLNGGQLTFTGNNAGGAASSETVGSVVLARGHSTIQSTAGTGTGATATLTAGTLLRNPGATVNFAGANLGTPSNRILFGVAPPTAGVSSLDGTGIWPFATFAASDFATYSPADGVKVFTGYISSIAAAGPGDTVRLQNVSETVTADKTINALFLTNNGPTSNVTLNAGATLTLASGGLSMAITGGISTPAILPSPAASGGTLAFGGEGIVFSNVGIFSDSINTRIAGGAGLTIGGSSTLNINPPGGSSYTGGTTLNSGGLNVPVGAVNPLGAPGNLFTYFAGTIASGGFGSLTLDYPLNLNNARVNIGGLTAIALNGPVTLTGFNTFEGGSLFPTLMLGGAITGSGSLSRLSGENLVLSGSNNYTGGTTVSSGNLLVNGSQPAVPVTLIGGTLGGTGSVGPITTLTGGVVNPGSPAATRGILSAAGADFSSGGNLRIEVAGLTTAGVDYDRLNLGGGTLTVGGNSRLTVDLAGLASPGRVNGVVLYGNRAGTIPTFNTLEVVNNPNNFLVVPEYTANALNLIISGSPVVTSFTPNASGFTVQFSRPINPAVLNLYDGLPGSLGPADVTVAGSNGPVNGSLIVNPSGTAVTFVATGGVLPPGTYSVRLRSAADGFVHPSGDLLDGNRDGVPGDDYVTTFTAAPAAVVVSVPDFMRGPGQAVNVPATATGLPLRISDGSGVTSISLTLRYDPNLLAITDAAPAPGTPAGSTVSLNPTTPGLAVLSFFSPTPLGTGARDFLTLTANVPTSAVYASKEVLDISGLSINSGAIAGTDDDGVHVVGYFGDTTGNGSYSSTDATRALRVALGLDTGFTAYQLADPVIIADITGNGVINSTDATRILQQAIGIPQAQIPPLPAEPVTIPPSGPDPLLNIPPTLRGRRGRTVTVPVNLDRSEGLDSADLVLAYDTSRLELISVRRGRLTRDFDLFAVNRDDAAGTIRVGLGRSAGPIGDRGAGSVLQVTFRVQRGALAGAAVINLRHGLGGTLTQLNEGGLLLNPAPSDEAGDPLDGAVIIGGRTRPPIGVTAADLVDAVFARLGKGGAKP
jgi:autotransporter-associated beta strand protein